MSLRLGGKGCIIAVILLLAGVSIVPDLGANRTFNNTIYVDDDNIEGPWDGTQEYPFRFIQDAIEASSDGDTAFVYSGTYCENIEVHTSIHLVGENWTTTIIDGSGKKNVLITANWVNITGFQIISSGDHYHGAIEIRSSHNRISKNWITKSFKDAIEVEENASENIIVDNFIYENEEGIGIYICDAEKNIIKKNYFIDNRYEGLWLVRSSENLVTENVFTNNLIGVQVAVFSNNNTIENNLLESNQCGIELNYLCNHNKIKDNILNNFGTLNLFIKESSNNLVDNNTLSGTSEGITLHQSSHNIITNNTIQHIREFSLTLALDSNNNMVALNTIVDNEMIGLILHDASNNTIIENIITDNQEHGLYLERYSNDNLISKNHIASNNGYVIYFDNSSYNEITYNNLIFNKRNVYFQNSQNTWDKNYWNRPRFLPKIIFGTKTIQGSFDEDKSYTFPWINIDWHPAKVPNEIVSNPFAIIETNMGTMKLELYKDKVPITVENFIKLANDGFYDGLVFHRVIDDFVIQGGGYYANGTHKISPYGPIELEIHPDVRHVDGAISMARTSDPNSATSQFFICDGKQSFLDDNYAAFGKIIVGINVLRDVASVETSTKYRMKDWPVDDIAIESVTILNQ